MQWPELERSGVSEYVGFVCLPDLMGNGDGNGEGVRGKEVGSETGTGTGLVNRWNRDRYGNGKLD